MAVQTTGSPDLKPSYERWARTGRNWLVSAQKVKEKKENVAKREIHVQEFVPKGQWWLGKKVGEERIRARENRAPER